eukprot:PITA_05451
MIGKVTMQKYVDPGSPIVKTTINGVEIPNTLIDLGADINIMSRQTMEQLKLPNLLFTPTLLQLADRSIIKPNGVLEEISVSLDSWEYPVDFMILTPKSNLGGHPLILGRPWLATADAFISCRSGDMYIFDGNSTKNFNLYPPAKAITEIRDNEWIDDEDTIQPVFTISEISEDSQILNTLENFETSSEYDHTQFQLDSNIEYLSSRQMSLFSMEEFGSSAIEIFPRKNIEYQQKFGKITIGRANQNLAKTFYCICMGVYRYERRDWAESLPEALWAYRTTWRNTTGHSPYELVYGKEVLLPIEFQVKTFKMAVQLGMNLSEAQKHRMEQLNQLDEIRQDAILRTDLVQHQRAKWHDRYIKERKFQEGDWALLFDSKFKYFKGKF